MLANCFLTANKPGTAQGGVISKAQYLSRKNSAFCEIFHLSHSAEKCRKSFPEIQKKYLAKEVA